MCWLALADVIQGGITFRLINLDMLFTTAHQLSYQAFLPRLAGTPFIFLSPPTFRYLVRPRNIDVNCHPRSVFVLFRCESAALFTHSCRVSPRSEGSDDGFIYTALRPPIISKIITNFENIFQFADVRRFLLCPTCPNLAQIRCNLLWVSYNLASLRQVGETRELRITPFLASFILVAVRLELDKLFSVLTSC